MKILFIGFNHRKKDPRLYYREMTAIGETIPESRIYFAQQGRIWTFDELEKSEAAISNWHNATVITKIYTKLKNKIRGLEQTIWLLYKVNRLKPDVVQASDAREIPFTLLLKLTLNSVIIYDAHEDYVRQALDYNKNIVIKYYRAVFLWAYELIGIRFFDHVFCTDDSLYDKYRERHFGAKNVGLLRNFPPLSHVNRNLSGKPYKENGYSLNVVYIGGVNAVRGVIEVAEYIERFNDEESPPGNVSLTLYSPNNKIVSNLAKKKHIYCNEWIDFECLNDKLQKYDVGVCIWKNIPKFKRNLPLKNFDYMAAGLPILTSNFGNLHKYAEESGAAVCIDPDSYDQFRSAVLRLMDQSVRDELSRAGQEYVFNCANFEKEAINYLRVFKENVQVGMT